MQRRCLVSCGVLGTAIGLLCPFLPTAAPASPKNTLDLNADPARRRAFDLKEKNREAQ